MYTFLVIVHVIVAILLIIVVLMQSSKGGGLAGAFGGGASGGQAVFGGRGAASFLQKLTVGLAAVFMILALLINIIGPGGQTQHSVVQEAAQQHQLTPGTSLPKPAGTNELQGIQPLENTQQQQQAPATTPQGNNQTPQNDQNGTNP